MTDQTFFGLGDDAAEVEGYGPIPGELARELVAGATEAHAITWLRRLCTSPTSGELVNLDARSLEFRAGMVRLIRLRDGHCRTPWCDAPIRHVDHVLAEHAGGLATRDNGQGLCEACNYAKEAPRLVGPSQTGPERPRRRDHHPDRPSLHQSPTGSHSTELDSASPWRLDRRGLSGRRGYPPRVSELQQLRADHAPAILAFESANRAYFAASISDRGDEYFEQFHERLDALLEEQEAGVGAYFVLLADDGAVLGRFNLMFAEDGVAELGYRVAQHAAGRGVATAAVREVCSLATSRHGIATVRAAAADANVASQRVLLKAGFRPVGPADPAHLGGKQGRWYELDLE